ncbi:hypothetical protein B0H19DRAFT_268363 [Mycena capillaripes]|nr:hypothetical protein B0H19DRAFT_268363 [Mycena capillaripes]
MDASNSRLLTQWVLNWCSLSLASTIALSGATNSIESSTHRRSSRPSCLVATFPPISAKASQLWWFCRRLGDVFFWFGFPRCNGPCLTAVGSDCDFAYTPGRTASD